MPQSIARKVTPTISSAMGTAPSSINLSGLIVPLRTRLSLRRSPVEGESVHIPDVLADPDYGLTERQK